MRGRWTWVAIGCGLLLGSCGGATVQPAVSQIAVTTVTPATMPGAGTYTFDVTGGNFSQIGGSQALIRLRAATGTPFAGGTSDTAEVTATITGATTLTATSPAGICVPPGTVVGCEAEVELPTGFVGTSNGAVLTLEGASVSGPGGGIAPLSVAADIAEPFTITGSGFGLDGTSVVVTFTAAGTPFMGGLANSVDVMGTVAGGGTRVEAAACPIATLATEANLVAEVTLTLDAACGAAGVLAVGQFTFRTPRVFGAWAFVNGAYETGKMPAGVAFRVTGSDLGPPGSTPLVRFQARAGTPFPGPSDIIDVPATLVSSTEVTGTVPTGTSLNPVLCEVSVRLQPTGNAATLAPDPHLMPPPFVPDDPLFADQWHWQNTGQTTGTPGEDVNVVSAWGCGITGAGVVVGVCDSGVDFLHEDLDPNKDLANSWNPRTDSPRVEPTSLFPTIAGRHGTVVSGMIAARGGNGLGLCGAAPHASIADLPLAADASFSVSDSQFLRAQTHAMENISVRNNSWGFGAVGIWISPGSAWLDALETGLTQGRGGLGNAYCWSSGNGGHSWDWGNEDEHHNHRACIVVGSIDHDGYRTYYSTPGANTWITNYGGHVVAPRNGVVSTDEHGTYGYVSGDYLAAADGLQGTSFSSPATAGVVALILQANPGLYVRDVKEILARTARRNDPLNAHGWRERAWLVSKGLNGWLTNAAGLTFNVNYGFGVPDCHAAVETARTWTPHAPMPPWVDTTHETVSVAIPDNDPTGVQFTWDASACPITSIDEVQLLFSTSHVTHANLGLLLTSPGGTTIPLSVPHGPTQATGPLSDYLLGTGGFLGEVAAGTWTLTLSDEFVGSTGAVTGLVLRIHGRIAAAPLLGLAPHRPASIPTNPSPGGVLPDGVDPDPAPLSPFVRALRSDLTLTDTLTWQERRIQRTAWIQPGFLFEIDPSETGRAAMTGVDPGAVAAVRTAELRLWRLATATPPSALLGALATAAPGSRFAPAVHDGPRADAPLRVPTGKVFCRLDEAFDDAVEVAAWARAQGYAGATRTILAGNLWLLDGRPLPEHLAGTSALLDDTRVTGVTPEFINFR